MILTFFICISVVRPILVESRLVTLFNKEYPTKMVNSSKEIWCAHPGSVLVLKFSPSGELFASAGGTTFEEGPPIMVWNLTKHHVQAALFGHDNTVRDIAFSSDGSKLASASADGTIRVWDVRTRAVTIVERSERRSFFRVTFCNDDSALAFTDSDGGIQVAFLDKSKPSIVRGPNRFGAEALLSSADYLFAAGLERSIRVWNLKTKREECVLLGHRRPIEALAFDPDRGQLVSADWDGNIFVWDTDKLRKKAQYFDKSVGRIASMSFLGKGLLLILGDEGKLFTCDLDSGRFESLKCSNEKTWRFSVSIKGAVAQTSEDTGVINLYSGTTANSSLKLDPLK